MVEGGVEWVEIFYGGGHDPINQKLKYNIWKS